REVGRAMARKRSCAWMSGPQGAEVKVLPIKWWLALSRGTLVAGVRRASRHRPPVRCHRTPMFVSPLAGRHK
ncbi:MAG: hypothetical protein M3214_02805, partial [Actinomycetota bacterium]|nr:hypothetical protein [Actinomycetota bacterium]